MSQVEGQIIQRWLPLYNADDSPKIVLDDGKIYTDQYGVNFTGSVTLAPWSCGILKYIEMEPPANPIDIDVISDIGCTSLLSNDPIITQDSPIVTHSIYKYIKIVNLSYFSWCSCNSWRTVDIST